MKGTDWHRRRRFWLPKYENSNNNITYLHETGTNLYINIYIRYLPISAMKLMYDSLILSHLQFGITNWGFEWDRISKLQKRALRIMTNSRYNAHTEPLFKQLHLLKVKDIFDVQCLKFWYKFVNNELPNYFRNMFTYNHELHDFETRNRDRLHLYQTRTSGARNVLRQPTIYRNYWIDFPSIWLTKWRRIVCILLLTI